MQQKIERILGNLAYLFARWLALISDGIYSISNLVERFIEGWSDGRSVNDLVFLDNM